MPTQPSSPRRSIFRSSGVRLAGGAVLGLLLFAGGFTLWRLSVHNEGVVEPGRLYRSAQLTAAELRKEIGREKIQSVLNLRGENHASPWYQDEMNVCRELNVRHFDIRMSAGSLPPPDEVVQLLADLQDAPRPILVHCRSGSDRTGLVACVYLIDQDHLPWQKAEGALSWQYGHFPIYPYFAMDKFVQLYGQSGNPSFRDWAQHEYPAIYARESRGSKWDRMIEPAKFFVRGRVP